MWLDWDSLANDIAQDSSLQKIISELQVDPTSHPHYVLIHHRLYFKSRLVLPATYPWVPKLITEFHSTLPDGHSGAYRTYRRIAVSFYWHGMMKMITAYVASCLVCQQVKYETQSPTGFFAALAHTTGYLGSCWS